MHWYPVFAAQFHMRVLGQIFKLKQVNGRDDLMQHRERLEAYIEEELNASPLLSDIKAMYERKKG
jgi:aminoglycoside/choline kinase family phosphotransferase